MYMYQRHAWVVVLAAAAASFSWAASQVGELFGCHCPTDEFCHCCAHLKFNDSILRINDTVCAEIQYLPQPEDLELDLKLNGRKILDKKIDIKHLSKECVGIPYIKKAAEICADFTKINISDTELDACIDIDVEILKAKILDVHVGCFRLHIPHEVPSSSAGSDVGRIDAGGEQDA